MGSPKNNKELFKKYCEDMAKLTMEYEDAVDEIIGTIGIISGAIVGNEMIQSWKAIKLGTIPPVVCPPNTPQEFDIHVSPKHADKHE